MKNNSNIPVSKRLYRQGDVLVMPLARKEAGVNNIPEKLKRTKNCTLALGEATGHHHSVLDGSAIGFADDEKALSKFVEAKSTAGAPLVHQEHDTIVLPEGQYRVFGQVEYTPEKLQRVAD